MREVRRNLRELDERVCSAKVRRASRVSSLDILLFVITLLLLGGILMMLFGVSLKELPTSVNVIWWTLVSFVGAWIVSLGM